MNRSKEYFEGWYFKHVSKDEKSAISFIPGVSLTKKEPHCFIQYIYVSLDENNKKIIQTGYHKFPLDDFAYSDDPFLIQIENNRFTESALSVTLKDQNNDIHAVFRFDPFHSIKKSILMPNMMGIFSYFPKMECYHDVISMNHLLYGALCVNGVKIDFNRGKGYIETDRGTSFPKKYIWIQCNNFKNKNCSFFCSVAEIPFMKKSFPGFICNLVIDNEEYRFATYNCSKYKIEWTTEETMTVSFESSKARLNIEANLANTGELIAPQQGRMEKVIKEGLSGHVNIQLYNKQNGFTYEDTGNMAGIEVLS